MLSGISMGSVKRGLARGWTSCLRDRFGGTTIVLLAAVLTLTQLLVLARVGAAGVEKLLISKGDLYIEVLPGAPDQGIQELYAALRAQPFVSAVEFTPSDKAIERERASNSDLAQFLDTYDLGNPFPDSFSITLTSLEYYNTLVQFAGDPQWKNVVDPAFLSSMTVQEQDVRQMLSIADSVGNVASLLVVLCVIVLGLIIVELIERRARYHGHELFLEDILGASPADALLPVIAEAAILLVVALLIGTVATLLMFLLLPVIVPEMAEGGVFAGLFHEMQSILASRGPVLLLIELLLMPAIAAGGVLAGMRKGPLKVPLLRS